VEEAAAVAVAEEEQILAPVQARALLVRIRVQVKVQVKVDEPQVEMQLEVVGVEQEEQEFPNLLLLAAHHLAAGSIKLQWHQLRHRHQCQPPQQGRKAVSTLNLCWKLE